MSTGGSGRGVADIAPARRALLDAGTIEAATLTECLAVDFATLMRSAFPMIDADAVAEMRDAAGEGITRRMTLAARLILEWRGIAALGELRSHPADTVRGWACFMVGVADHLYLAERFALIRPLADDPHFGVREWAWMAVRPHVAAELDAAVTLLAGWASDPSERLRRFASEATRPRGVWCAHIRSLRQSPELALPILEPLRADPAAYVQNSVGNWLNDAGKDQPDWVRALCARWSAESDVPATDRIRKRALRSIGQEL